MKPVFVLCFILTFFVKDGTGSVSTFFDQIGNAFKITWNSVVDAIKRPARHRASASQRRSLKFLSTQKPYVWTSPEDSEIFLNDISKSATDIKVTLPLILLPKYKTLEKWIKHEAERMTTTQSIQAITLSSFKAVVSDEGLKLSEEESNIFGPLVFI